MASHIARIDMSSANFDILASYKCSTPVLGLPGPLQTMAYGILKLKQILSKCNVKIRGSPLLV